MNYKIFFPAFLILFLISCNSSETGVEMKNSDATSNERSKANQNLAAWHKVTMAFESGNFNVIDSVIAHDYLDHRMSGDVRGRDSVKASIIRGQANFRDVKLEMIREQADDEYGFFWMRFSGNNISSPGMATGPFDMTSIQVVRFRDGMAIEHWEYMDMKDIVKRLPSRTK